MSNYNLNAGYGQLMAERIALGLGAGKIFIVGKSAVPYRDVYADLFPNDIDGVPRFSATIAGAIAMCTASAGDNILVLPGHTETISAAAGIALSKAGVTLKALGNGSNRATLTFDTATTATMTLAAANVTLDGFVLGCIGFDAIVSPLVISAANVAIKNCLFTTADGTNQAVQAILTTAAANNLLISGCRFMGTVDAGTTAAITLVGGDNATIIDNDFIGAYSSGVGAIRSITTLNSNCVIKRNTIVNLTASATKGITLLTGSTGVISDNRFGIGSGTAPITADAAWWNANYSSAAVATNGTLV